MKRKRVQLTSDRVDELEHLRAYVTPVAPEEYKCKVSDQLTVAEGLSASATSYPS